MKALVWWSVGLGAAAAAAWGLLEWGNVVTNALLTIIGGIWFIYCLNQMARQFEEERKKRDKTLDAGEQKRSELDDSE